MPDTGGYCSFMGKGQEMVGDPYQSFVGKTVMETVEVSCEGCEKLYVISIPLEITRVEGTTGYGPGGSISATCPVCGLQNEYTWSDCIVEITGG